jgi:hypothetical protein
MKHGSTLMDTDFFIAFMRTHKLDELAEKVHDSWVQQKKLCGFHAPENCPQIVSRVSGSKAWYDETFCAKCHKDMRSYADLPENVKEYDRVTVRAVLDAMEAVGA